MSPDPVILIEMDGYTDVGVFTTYRFSMGGGDAAPGYCTLSTDTPPDAYYAPRVMEAGKLTRSMFGESGGAGLLGSPDIETAYGSTILVNIDGELDAVFGTGAISFKEREIRYLLVDPEKSYSTAILIMRGTISQCEMAVEHVVVSVKDRMYLLSSAHLTTTYLGDNVLPAGVEGTAELTGKIKPLVLGKVFNIAPPQVNTSRRIYQVSTAAVQSVDAVRDGGVALTPGAVYTSQVDMETNVPAASGYRVWPAGGMFRLGSLPARAITCDVTGDTSANSTAAQLIKRMATERGIAAGDINAADVAALDILNNAVLGVWVFDSRTTRDIVSELARSVGAYTGFDRLGVLRMGRLDEVSGTAVTNIAQWNCGALTSLLTGEDVPTAKVTVKYARYTTVQQGGELGLVTEAQKSDLAQEFRAVSFTVTVVPNPHVRLQETTRETALTTAAAALAEATRLAGLCGQFRRSFKVTDVYFKAAEFQSLDLNTVVGLLWDRYGFSTETPTLRRITQITYDWATRSVELIIWGS